MRYAIIIIVMGVIAAAMGFVFGGPIWGYACIALFGFIGLMASAMVLIWVRDIPTLLGTIASIAVIVYSLMKIGALTQF